TAGVGAVEHEPGNSLFVRPQTPVLPGAEAGIRQRAASEWTQLALLLVERLKNMAGHARLLDCFNQHGAGLTTANTFCGYATFNTGALQGVDQVQHNPVATGPDRMAEADCTAVDVQAVAVECAPRGLAPEGGAAEVGVVEGRQAGQDLRRKGFVEFPQVDVIQRQLMAREQVRDAEHRRQSHDGGIQCGPLAVEDDGLGFQSILLHGFFRSEYYPGGAVGDL